MQKSKHVTQMIAPQVAHTFYTKFFGLMGKDIHQETSLLLMGCNSIHTFFMKSAIDVIFLGQNYTVLKVYTEVQPAKIRFCWAAKHCLETAPGLYPDLSVGDNIKINP